MLCLNSNELSSKGDQRLRANFSVVVNGVEYKSNMLVGATEFCRTIGCPHEHEDELVPYIEKEIRNRFDIPDDEPVTILSYVYD